MTSADVLRTTLELRLADAPTGTLVTMPGSASLLDPCLDTPCVGLVVHVDDVAASVGVPVLPVLAYRRATAVLPALAGRASFHLRHE